MIKNWSFSYIYHISYYIVYKLWATNYKTIQKSKGGRKPKLSAEIKKYILYLYRSGEDTASDIACKLWQDTGIDISHDTIAYVLKEAGLKSRHKPKKPRFFLKYKKVYRD